MGWLDYKDLPGPGQVDKYPDKTTQFDRYDWSRKGQPEKNFVPPQGKKNK